MATKRIQFYLGLAIIAGAISLIVERVWAHDPELFVMGLGFIIIGALGVLEESGK